MSRPFDPARWRPADLLPARDAQDGAAMAAIGLLAAFACLACIAGLAANRAANGWIGQLSGAASVVVRPKGQDTPDQAAARAAEVLAGAPGVVEARALPESEIKTLLAPWLGEATDLADLPVPRLVDLTLSRRAPPSAETLQGLLDHEGLDATVDDHRAWTGAVERGAQFARWTALGVCALTAIAAAAIIAFATRASLAAKAEMIAILHLTGGKDGHVARLFAAHAAVTGALAAAAGGIGAAVIAALLRLIGGAGGVVPFLPVAWSDLLAVLVAPLAGALLAALAADFTARALLRSAP